MRPIALKALGQIILSLAIVSTLYLASIFILQDHVIALALGGAAALYVALRISVVVTITLSIAQLFGLLVVSADVRPIPHVLQIAWLSFAVVSTLLVSHVIISLKHEAEKDGILLYALCADLLLFFGIIHAEIGRIIYFAIATITLYILIRYKQTRS